MSDDTLGGNAYGPIPGLKGVAEGAQEQPDAAPEAEGQQEGAEILAAGGFDPEMRTVFVVGLRASDDKWVATGDTRVLEHCTSLRDPDMVDVLNGSQSTATWVQMNLLLGNVTAQLPALIVGQMKATAEEQMNRARLLSSLDHHPGTHQRWPGPAAGPQMGGRRA